MATIKGIKNRLGAAHRAARRALNGDYALVDNKPMVRLEPVEVKSGTIYLTKNEAMEATKKEELRVAEEKRLAEIEAWNRYVIKDDSDKTVGLVDRESFSFMLKDPQFAYAGNSKHNAKFIKE